MTVIRAGCATCGEVTLTVPDMTVRHCVCGPFALDSAAHLVGSTSIGCVWLRCDCHRDCHQPVKNPRNSAPFSLTRPHSVGMVIFIGRNTPPEQPRRHPK